MEEKEKIELGRIKAELGIPYLSILALSIDEEKNEHGKLSIRLMVKGDTPDESIISLQNSSIKVKTPDGDCIFSGIILNIGMEGETQYKEIILGALSYSCLSDIKRNSRTFQDPSIEFRCKICVVCKWREGCGTGGCNHSTYHLPEQ